MKSIKKEILKLTINSTEFENYEEYSAFFGSIQIFQYLFMNNIELKTSLWIYSIHSKNAELIHLLESNEINPPKLMNNKSKDELENDFKDYIENNLIYEQEMKSKEEIKMKIVFFNKYF